MHISGKILAGFVLLLGAVAIWLSGKTLGIRQSYMELAQKNKQEFLQKEQQLAEALAERDRKRAEYVRAIAGWERVYEGPNVSAGVDPSGIVVINGVGTGNGVKVGDVLYLFALGQEAGSSQYVGSIQVADAADGRVSGRPYTRIRPGEINPTNEAFPARVRKLVPTRFQDEMSSLDQRLLLLEQSLANAGQDATFLKDLQERTDMLIDDRMKEINGNPALENSRVPEVNKTGLLAAIVKEEDLRNTALQQGDDLLRRLLRTRQKTDELLQENRQLTKSLPAGVSAPALPQASAESRRSVR